MSRRKSNDKNIRKIQKSGNSYAVTLPIEIIREFGWREKQKVVIKKRGNCILITDWE